MAPLTRFVHLPRGARPVSVAADMADRGPADPTETVEISVRLRRRADTVGAASFTPPPDRHLTHDELMAAYGADEADLDAVLEYADARGLEVVLASPERRTVVLSGALCALRAAFPADVRRVEIGGRRYRQRVGELHVPEALAGVVEGVFGYTNRPHARPRVVLPDPSQVAPALDSRLPTEIAALYDFPPGFDGAGQCIGVLEFGGGYHDADMAEYFASLRLPRPTIVAVPVGGVQNAPGVNRHFDLEVTLDVQVAAAIAPGARVAVYFSDWSERGWVDAVNAAVHDRVNKPSVISISWGWPELDGGGRLGWSQAAVDAINAALEEAALLGITVIAAAGDEGSGDGIDDGRVHVDFPASSPHVLSCGGTSLRVAAGSAPQEVAWKTACGTTGGGVSDLNPLPGWQDDAQVPPSLSTGIRGRGVPDVAADAGGAIGYTIDLAGLDVHGVTGTSAVAPLYAGLIARINQALGKPVGYLNPLLYQTLAGKGVCRDVTDGDNDSYEIGAYSARKGWDPVTGWGSIIGTRLLEALRALARATLPPAHAASQPAPPRSVPPPRVSQIESLGHLASLAPEPGALGKTG